MVELMWTPAVANALGVGTIALAALFALTLLRARISRRVHTVLLIVVANRLLIQLEAVLETNGITQTYPILFGIGFPFKLLAPCLYYFFFRSAVEPSFKWSKKDLLHALPFLIGIVIYLFLHPHAGIEITPELIANERYFRTWVWLLVALPYLWTIHRLMTHARDRLMQSQSDLDHLHLNWLNIIILLAFFGTGLSMVDIMLGPETKLWPIEPAFNAVGLFAMIWASIKTCILFQPEDPESANSVEIKPEELQKLKALLDVRLEKESLYLKPGLKLSDLAEAMGQKSYLVSQVIKQGYETNFYDLVNRLRIEHAKKRLSRSEDNSKILAVALESGFNSKSTFNDLFRRTVGMTPSEFKRSNRANSEPN